MTKRKKFIYLQNALAGQVGRIFILDQKELACVVVFAIRPGGLGKPFLGMVAAFVAFFTLVVISYKPRRGLDWP